eukprot:6183419-Pleurochrysis_carterae.AAC.1
MALDLAPSARVTVMPIHAVDTTGRLELWMRSLELLIVRSRHVEQRKTFQIENQGQNINLLES